MTTGLVSGVVSTWAKWVGGVQTDLLRMNVIGIMSNLAGYDDNAPLTADGKTALT
jgi:hypothetical protein